jgi:DNA replication factor GINS
MYSELYAAWQHEIENTDLQPLPADFYARVAEYLRRIKEENSSADQKTVRKNLLESELRNVNRIVKELLRVRRKKLMRTVASAQKLPSDMLTTEESEIFAGFLPFTQAYRQLVKSLLQGQTSSKTEKSLEKEEVPHKRVALRFLKPVPAIIGSDMKTYGPFVAEDVASVPVENAKILTKQGFAEPIEVS